MDKTSLLNQLRIDRGQPFALTSSRVVWWAAAAALVITGGGFAAWRVSQGTAPRATSAATPTAGAEKEAATIGAVARASLLDASGYVVARRRATVASKVTGKVVEVSLEEGQRVKEGQIVARLDDSNARSALMRAETHVKQAEAVVAAAQSAFDDALPMFERNQREKAAGVISAQSFDQARAQLDASKSQLLVAVSGLDEARSASQVAQRDLEDTVIRAPFAGVVTEKAAQKGARWFHRFRLAAASPARALAPLSI